MLGHGGIRLGTRPPLLHVKIVSDPKILCVVRDAIHTLAGTRGFSEEKARAITLAVDEALANVIRHAYGGREDKAIQISCWELPRDGAARGKRGLEILLVDRGRPPANGRLRCKPVGELRPGGLGLHFMRQSMDKVVYTRVGFSNRLRMIKYV
jgi:serine/threonine-protein kinase RsbW